MVAVPVQLEASPRGGLSIWEMPDPARKYVIGADTAGGLARGDFANAVVVDGETCDVVATWRERHDPNVWGPECAMLGWFYGGAVLAVETHPSAHGLSCVREAMHFGYTNVYYRTQQDKYQRVQSDKLGWSTDSVSKPQLIDRVRRAIQDANGNGTFPIRCPKLLDELHEQHWNDKGEMESAGHDDFVMAYGIALMVRDQCWRKGELRVEVAPPNSEEARYWASREKLLNRSVPRQRPKLRIA